jgi:hypothetical protein
MIYQLTLRRFLQQNSLKANVLKMCQPTLLKFLQHFSLKASGLKHPRIF